MEQLEETELALTQIVELEGKAESSNDEETTLPTTPYNC